MAKSKKRLEAEKDALASLAAEGWKAAPAAQTEELVEAARAWAAENKRKKPKERQISLRLDEDMILVGQHRAAQEGLTGYQTLMKSVFYRYLTGKLVDPEMSARAKGGEKVK